MAHDTLASAQLSSISQQVAECYAVVYPERPARSRVMQWLNNARRSVLKERAIKSDEMSEAIQELVGAGLLWPSVKGEKGVSARGPSAMPGTLTRFCLAAHQRGTAGLILRELDSSVFAYSRQFDVEQHLEQHVRLALIADKFERFADQELPHDILYWLTEPRAKPLLARLPEHSRQPACVFGLRYLVHNLQPFSVFATTCEELAPDFHALQPVLIQALVYQGKFRQAKEKLEKLQSHKSCAKQVHVECHALLALIKLLQGEDEKAHAALDAALTLEKSGTRKRLVYPDTLTFGMATLALIREDTVASVTLFRELMTARKKLGFESYLDEVLLAAECASQPHTDLGLLYLPGQPCVFSILFAIGSRWHQDYRPAAGHAGYLQWLQYLLMYANASEYHWMVAELLCVIEASVSDPKSLDPNTVKLLGKSSGEARHKALGSSTLTRLVTTLEPWEHTLRELEQLALKAKTPKKGRQQAAGESSRRLIWRLQTWHTDWVGVMPFEQRQGKNGQWTTGRRVALKRLLEQTGNLPQLLDQDKKACASIQKLNYGWGNKAEYETTQRTNYQLIGHPHVYDMDDTRVDVIERQPQLRMSEVDGELTLSFLPAFDSAHYTSELDTINQHLYVTHFTAAQRRICDALDGGTLKVPSGARDRLQGLLASLAGDIAIQGDADALTHALEKGDPQPLLELEQTGDAMRVRIRVEPLAGSGSYFDAASGGVVVYVQRDSDSISVQRDLTEERAQAQAMVTRSTVLSANYDGRAQMVLDDPLDALELLEEVQAAGIRCLWPSDMPLKIKARASISQVSLNIKSGKEWFSASGSLPLGEGDSDEIALERLLQLMSANPGTRFIELGEGEFLALSKTLQQQLETLLAFSRPGSAKSGDKSNGKTSASKIHPMALLALEPLLDNAQVKADKAWRDHRKHLQDTMAKAPIVPDTLQAEMRTYQVEGFQWLARLGMIGAGACLADDMGLGKTIQTLAVLLSRGKAGTALVVAPTSVTGNWLAEAQRFAPSLNVLHYADNRTDRHALLTSLAAFDIVVISYGLMVNDIEQLQEVHWHTLVLDEAQAIKNAATRRAKAARALVADFRIVTTGTPVQNNLMDLYSLYSFINPGLLGPESAFRKRFSVPITRDDDQTAREQLLQLVSPFLLRRLKRDVLKELPARTEITLNVQLSREEAILYEALRQEALDSLETSADEHNSSQQKIIILSYLTRLRRLCCNPKLIAQDWSGPMSKLGVFAETLAELIAGGHKALVFSQFVDHLKIIENHLQSENIQYQYLDGSTPAKKRSQRVAAFQAGEGSVFLISLTAGGTGLNLTAADYVIHLDPWWNPAVEDQASDRAHRLGQQRPVTIYRMVTTGTIEEQIRELHRSKRALVDSILTGADNVKFDMDMMMQLLRHSS